jgi:hypothetical protein
MSETVLVAIVEVITVVIASTLTSTGLWRYFENRKKKDSCEDKLLQAMAHDRIINLSKKALMDGSVTVAEFDSILLLYEPYVAMGGNGSAKRMFEAVKQLPIKEDHDLRQQIEQQAHVIREKGQVFARDFDKEDH